MVMMVGIEKFKRLNECPVCSSASLSAYRRSTFDLSSIKEENLKITDKEYGKIWNLSRCLDCGHIFANPLPSPSFIYGLYQKIEDPLYEEEARGRSRNFLRILSYLEKLHPLKGNLLDVGAATGILVHLALNRGWKAEGIEASKWAVKEAKRKYKIQLYEGIFEEASLKKDFYQVVTMVDFIEHTPLPLEALLRAREILHPQGTLCLVTPDIESTAAKLAGKNWWHYRPAHVSYFSFSSLATLLGRAGFSILKRRKYSWNFSAFYLLTRKNFLKRMTNSPYVATILKKVTLRLALGDSFEIYSKKKP